MYPRRRPATQIYPLILALLLLGARHQEAHAQNATAEAHEAAVDGMNRELGIVSDRFENAWRADDVQLASRLFDLESRALEHLRRLGNDRRSNVREQRMGETRAILLRVFELNEVLWERGIEKIQQANPGEPDAILTGKRVDRYRPLDRKGPKRPGGPDPKAAVREAKDASDAVAFDLDQSFIDSLPDLARVTWVRDGGKVKISADPNAKHLALSNGNDLNGAGDAVIMKNKRGRIVFAAVQYTSGSFKSGPASTEFVRQLFIERLKVPASRVTTTFSRPGSAGLVNLLLRAKGVDGDVADAHQTKLEQKADLYRSENRDLGRSIGRARRTDVAKLLGHDKTNNNRATNNRKRSAASQNAIRTRIDNRRKARNIAARQGKRAARRR